MFQRSLSLPGILSLASNNVSLVSLLPIDRRVIVSIVRHVRAPFAENEAVVLHNTGSDDRSRSALAAILTTAQRHSSGVAVSLMRELPPTFRGSDSS